MSTDTHSDGLIRRARDGDRDALGCLLEHYRGYLRISAQRRLQAPLAARMDASDVVQKTFLEAQRSFDRFQGANENQLLGWLRSILEHHLTDAVRDHLVAQKRSISQQRSLDDSRMGNSRAGWLAADQSSPSHRAIRAEAAIKLARALRQLPEDQREAVRLRHLEGWSLSELAEHFDRSQFAVAGLVKRGLQTLRTVMGADDDSTVRSLVR